MAREKGYFSEAQSVVVLRNKASYMGGIPKMLNKGEYNSFHTTVQTGSNQDGKRSRRPRCTVLQEDKNISL